MKSCREYSDHLILESHLGGTGSAVLASLFMAVLISLLMVFATSTTAYASSECFVLLADTHLGQPHKPSYKETKEALRWARSFKNLKAVCVAGDLTDRGAPNSYREWLALCKKQLGDAARIQALGDHDTGKDGDYLRHFPSLTVKNGYKYFRKINGGSATSFTQFDTANVITVGGVRAKGHHVITSKMLRLLNARLLKTARQGKVAIVVCHYPYDDSALNMRDKLMGVLRSYPNVIFVSGHKHIYPKDRQCQMVKPRCDTTPFSREGFSRKTKYPIRSVGVNACSAYRAANGNSYADLFIISKSGKMVLKKRNITKGRYERKWIFRQEKSSIVVKSAPVTTSYPEGAVFEYRISFSDGKTYGGVESGNTFSIVAGDTKRFANIPAGVLVTVTQTNAPEGWSTSSARTIEVGESNRTINMKANYSSLRLRAA